MRMWFIKKITFLVLTWAAPLQVWFLLAFSFPESIGFIQLYNTYVHTLYIHYTFLSLHRCINKINQNKSIVINNKHKLFINWDNSTVCWLNARYKHMSTWVHVNTWGQSNKSTWAYMLANRACSVRTRVTSFVLRTLQS